MVAYDDELGARGERAGDDGLVVAVAADAAAKRAGLDELDEVQVVSFRASGAGIFRRDGASFR